MLGLTLTSSEALMALHSSSADEPRIVRMASADEGVEYGPIRIRRIAIRSAQSADSSNPFGALDGSEALVGVGGDMAPHPEGWVSNPSADSPVVSCANDVDAAEAHGELLAELVVVLAIAGVRREDEGRLPDAGAGDDEPQIPTLSAGCSTTKETPWDCPRPRDARDLDAGGLEKNSFRDGG